MLLIELLMVMKNEFGRKQLIDSNRALLQKEATQSDQFLEDNAVSYRVRQAKEYGRVTGNH